MKSIGEISAFISDGDWIESKDQSESGIRLLQVGNIGLSEFIPKDERAKYISEETYAKLNCTEIFPGDILISRLPEPVGRACIVPEGLGRCITAVDCTILRLNESECDKRYFINYTQSPTYFFKLKRFLTGTTRIRISRKNLESVEIPLPPLDIQRQIADTLDKVTELIDLRKKQLEKLDELVKARFVELFGTLDYPVQEFKKATLKELCTKITDGKHGGCTQEEGTERYFVGAREIYDNAVHYDTAPEINLAEFEKDYKRCNVEIGDFLIVNTGATIGKSAIAIDPRTEYTLLQKSVALLKAKRELLNPVFLQYCYKVNEKMYKVESASAQPNLLLSKINSTKIYVPPIELQNQFAAFVEQTDKSKVIIQQSLGTLETLKKSLMQEYFG